MILYEHDPHWKSAFHELARVYRDVLGDLLVAIEHVGSTAIEGIAAKPILDIDLVINDYTVFPEVRGTLASLGYRHDGDLGIAQREVFIREDEDVPRHGDGNVFMRHHLYVCPKSSRELARHIAFRNYLNAHEEERLEYEGIKRSIEAKSNDDRSAYARIKEQEEACCAFVESVLAKSGLTGGP